MVGSVSPPPAFAAVQLHHVIRRGEHRSLFRPCMSQMFYHVNFGSTTLTLLLVSPWRVSPLPLLPPIKVNRITKSIIEVMMYHDISRLFRLLYDLFSLFSKCLSVAIFNIRSYLFSFLLFQSFTDDQNPAILISVEKILGTGSSIMLSRAHMESRRNLTVTRVTGLVLYVVLLWSNNYLILTRLWFSWYVKS